MKKKLLISGLLLVAALWWTTGVDPFWLLIEFVAAGALPGISFSLSPGMMLLLAIIAIIFLCHKAFSIELPKVNKKSLPTPKVAARARRRFERLTAK